MAAILLFSGSGTSEAAGFETLLMPGPVSDAHAKLEEECSSCHDRTDQTRQTALCLDCHKEVAADVRARTGFHGRMQSAQTGECQACHSEHRGRAADIVRLDTTGFDHDITDFHLEPGHVGLACDGCHRAGKPYRDAPTRCNDCHRDDDVHRGGLGTDCKSCHSATVWSRVTFDHEQTAFGLRGKHREVTCAACHAGERYRKTPAQCAACHAPDDVHDGNRGAQCADCHTAAGWKTAKFDHARETGFALLGSHARIACGDCHRSGNLQDPVPKDCAGCHRADDRHAGRFGVDCGGCHGNEEWRVETFDHARFKFDLDGAHGRIDCHACHTAVIKQQLLPTDCGGCHRADDVHAGALGGDCAQCHGVERWDAELRFDHDLTDYPLLGLHVIVTCAQCHGTQQFKPTARDCNGCHARHDVHKGSFGQRCADCHSPNGWNLWEFDHAARTRFPLTGAHAPLSCADCHIKPASVVRISMDCASCHAGDDVHAGQFGRQCDRCHSTVTFRGARANQGEGR